MPSVFHFPRARQCLLCALALALGGCSSLQSTMESVGNVGSWITPYRPDVIQGNFVSQEQLAQLRPGMPRAQVREILGSPLVTSAFHADRWDYSFTLRRQGTQAQQRKLVLFFNGDALGKWENDPLPSESEFVTQVDNRRKAGKVPRLEATEAELKAAQGNTAPVAVPATPGAATATTPTTYPPLERSPR